MAATTKRGRPARFTARTRILLTEQQLEALDRLAEERETTRAHEVRVAVNSHLASAQPEPVR